MNRHSRAAELKALPAVNGRWPARHRPATENAMNADEKDKVVPITRGQRPRMQIIFTPGPTSIEFEVQPAPDTSRHGLRRLAPSQQAVPGKLLPFRTAARKGMDDMKSFRIDENNRIQTSTGQPPVHLPFRRAAESLSRVRSPMIS